ncbi:MAG: hypothetical protein QOJ99_5912 [Bryobacterales bacterium]|nr:hypothetical protein [Bryobacterales bacterium]
MFAACMNPFIIWLQTLPGDDEVLLDRALDTVLPAMLRQGPVVAWVVDDTGFPKKGRHSVGVTRQYCGQVGKQDNCRVAVSLSVSTETSGMPVSFRLYLPEGWANDPERRKKAGVPEETAFQTKPQIALEQIQRARERGVPQGVVLADAGYGNDSQFRAQLTEWKLPYTAGIQSSVTVWKPGEQPAPTPKGKGMGRPPKLLQGDPKHQPVTVKGLALSLPPDAFKTVSRRTGVKEDLASRFAALRVRPAHRDYWRAEPHPEEWPLIEWPEGESEPAKYWLSTLPADMRLAELICLAKHRWIIERDYEELKQELGLGHFEGRGWRGFHHHATLCIVSYGFLVAERSLFSPSARASQLKITRRQTTTKLPAARFAPSGITRTRSRPSESSLPAI